MSNVKLLEPCGTCLHVETTEKRTGLYLEMDIVDRFGTVGQNLGSTTHGVQVHTTILRVGRKRCVAHAHLPITPRQRLRPPGSTLRFELCPPDFILNV